MLGTNTNDGDEISGVMRLLCTRPADAGSCVITIDHLPKSTEARTSGYAIGSIAKKRMIRGTYLRAEARTQPATGQIGRITLRIEKGHRRRTPQGLRRRLRRRPHPRLHPLRDPRHHKLVNRPRGSPQERRRHLPPHPGRGGHQPLHRGERPVLRPGHRRGRPRQGRVPTRRSQAPHPGGLHLHHPRRPTGPTPPLHRPVPRGRR